MPAGPREAGLEAIGGGWGFRSFREQLVMVFSVVRQELPVLMISLGNGHQPRLRMTKQNGSGRKEQSPKDDRWGRFAESGV